MDEKLYRTNKTDCKIGGVCGGIAKKLEVDPTIVRLTWAAAILLGGIGVGLYLLAWVIMPSENSIPKI